jgi:acetyl esterase
MSAQLRRGGVYSLNDYLADAQRVSPCERRQTDNTPGRIYWEHGQPVVVLVSWDGRGPRNVLIRRSDGTQVVRPFRVLRREAAA